VPKKTGGGWTSDPLLTSASEKSNKNQNKPIKNINQKKSDNVNKSGAIKSALYYMSVSRNWGSLGCDKPLSESHMKWKLIKID